MKILYVVPGRMSATAKDRCEMERRRGVLQSYSGPDIKVEIDDIPTGPDSIESLEDLHQAIPITVERIVRAEKENYSGIIIGCFADPGLEAARRQVSFPVIGPGESSFAEVQNRGLRFSVITVTDSAAAPLAKKIRERGWNQNLASLRTLGIPVLELRRKKQLVFEKVLAESLLACEREGAEAILLGCMSMAFLQIGDKLQTMLNIPVVDPARAAIKSLASRTAGELPFRSPAYPQPPDKEKNTKCR